MEPFVLVNDETPYFTISSWEDLVPNLSVGFSTKIGGTSVDKYKSMNLALHVNDSEESVVNNRKILSKKIDFSFDAWTCAEQVHCCNIEVVNNSNRGRGRLEQKDAISRTDGLVTDLSDILLTSYYADCVPLYFIDPKQKVIGLAHAGWKGTLFSIGSKMIELYVSNFDSKREDIRVAIGPSIGQCCYEVNSEIIDRFTETLGTLPVDSVINKKQGSYNIDLKSINYQIIKSAGITPENIELSSWCTSCNSDLFFSYRRDKGITGRMASWIGFKEEG